MSEPGAEHGFDLDAYLARLGLTGRPTLAELHHAHVSAIPFENLDPLRGVPVSLDPADLERKLVAEGRGGYCFEHNLLFAAALRALGVQAEPMLARVGPRENPDRTLSHLFLRVRDGGSIWHADVGFGSGTLSEPVPFGPGEEFDQLGWRRRIVAAGEELVLQAMREDGEWGDVYSFVPVPALRVDIEVNNWYVSTSPRSRFVQGLVITRHRDNGSRTVLSDWSGTLRLIEQRPGEERAQEVPREQIPALLTTLGLPGWELDERGLPAPVPPEQS
ncbi:MAG TPA: arylamine N-acetyltransferase [Solirubrobacteraceae bacterium]|nr:arylamine N-acetyltransferase [Solirubrobacteraceae bacterium]